MIYRVVTYDRTTERMKGNMPVPSRLLPKVKEIAGFQPKDDGLGEYLLDDEQTKKISKILGFRPETNRFYYYIEPYEPPGDDGLQQADAVAR
jgi:hypothetical protein